MCLKGMGKKGEGSPHCPSVDFTANVRADWVGAGGMVACPPGTQTEGASFCACLLWSSLPPLLVALSPFFAQCYVSSPNSSFLMPKYHLLFSLNISASSLENFLEIKSSERSLMIILRLFLCCISMKVCKSPKKPDNASRWWSMEFERDHKQLLFCPRESRSLLAMSFEGFTFVFRC